MEQKDTKTRPGLRYYWQIFLRRKWLIILPIVIIPVVAVPGSFLAPNIYRASAIVLAEEEEPGSIIVGGTASKPVPGSERMEVIKIKIHSRSYLREAADKVRIAEYTGSIGRSPDDILKYLRSIIAVRSMGGRLIEISAEHPTPAMAKNIANSISDIYVDKTLMWRHNIAREVINFLERQMEVYWQRLTDAEDELAKAQQKSPLGYLSEEASSLVTEVARIRTELFENEIDMREAKKELEEAKRLSEGDVQESHSSSALHLDPAVAKIQAELVSLQTRYKQLSSKYTDQYPEIRKLKEEIVWTREKLQQAKNEFDTWQQDIPSRLKYWHDRVRALEVRNSALNEEINEYNLKIQMLPQRELELARLQREKSVADSTYSMLLNRLNNFELLQTAELGDMGRPAEVLDPAIEPEKPIRPNRMKIAFLAVTIGMALGFGSAFLLEYFDRSFRSVDEIEDYLHLPVLAAIPRLTTYESELKDNRYRRVKIACIVSISLLVLILIGDVGSAQVFERDSVFLNVARVGINFLREQLIDRF